MRAFLWAVPPDLYPAFVRAGTFALDRVGRKTLAEVQPGDTVFAYLTDAQTLAGQFEAVAPAFDDTTPLVSGRRLPHRLRVRPVLVLPDEGHLPVAALAGRLDVTAAPETLRAAVAKGLAPLSATDGRVLAFLLRSRASASVDAALDAYARLDDLQKPTVVAEPTAAEPTPEPAPFPFANAAEALVVALAARGFAYAPWQVAAYLTALRTKPFVLLAGPTGTGKSRLPMLVTRLTGGHATLLPVRPDWTDGAEALGYTDLHGRFRPGALLRAAREAADDPERSHVLVLDEMNLARPEHYLADVLSHLEARRPTPRGLASGPLLPDATDPAWQTVGLPPNLALVGTVNVDESAHGFSPKVLDRAFVLELRDTTLRDWQADLPPAPRLAPWPAAAFAPRAERLAALPPLTEVERRTVDEAVEAVAEMDALLGGATYGYRTRDEVALFALHARDLAETFRTADGQAVSPLDLALSMKALPRLAGSRARLGPALLALLGFAAAGTPFASDRDAAPTLDRWRAARRPAALDGARLPRTAARLARMHEALLADGFASFWG